MGTNEINERISLIIEAIRVGISTGTIKAGREIALVVTKLEEAGLWLTKVK